MININLCNCATCPHRDEWSAFPFTRPCPLSDYNRLNPHDIFFIVEHIGCQSHPKAKETMMKDVIEELEARSCMSESYDAGRACEDAIGLIKNGVKKE